VIKAFTFAMLTAALILLPRELSAQQVRAQRIHQISAAAAGPCDLAQGTPPQGDGRGFDRANLDRTVKPCDDFVEFAMGGWLKNNPVPADRPIWGAWNKVQDQNEEILHQILEEAAKNREAAAGSVQKLIGNFYASCMDADEIEKAGLEPLRPELNRIAALGNAADLPVEFARLQIRGIFVPFFFGSLQDFKDSSQQIAFASQAGLGMPNRDYYTKTDEKSKDLRDRYVQHVARMFKLMGDDEPTAEGESKTVMALETKLAKASMTPIQERILKHIDNKMSLGELKTLMPDFSWEAYFRELGFPGIDSVIVAQKNFFRHVNEQLQETSLADWKTYLRWHLIHAAAPSVSSDFGDENFDFYGRALTGLNERSVRWKRCVRATDEHLGEALGQEYVKRAFPPEAKAQALDMIHKLIGVMREDLSNLDWMGPETKELAEAKLDAMVLKIGYPDKWRDYSSYQLGRGPYIEEVWRVNEYDFRRDLGKIGKPVDRIQWDTTPQSVDASYNPSMNELVFPAGILQPPFFDPKRDDAMNYGAIGAVIGHELTHAFDAGGAQFDAEGNAKTWWTPKELKTFRASEECVIKQFDNYQAEPGLHENGKLEIREIVADLGGLTIAHAAYEKSLEGKPKPADIDGFTNEQRLFLAWAQIWAENVKPEYARRVLDEDSHPLGRFRTNGPLSNMASFSQAFGCSAGSPMVRAGKQLCRIW
jgi:putative endopeptidase